MIGRVTFGNHFGGGVWWEQGLGWDGQNGLSGDHEKDKKLHGGREEPGWSVVECGAKRTWKLEVEG